MAKPARRVGIRMWMLVNRSGQPVSRPARYWSTITDDWSPQRRKAMKLKRRRVLVTWTEPARKERKKP